VDSESTRAHEAGFEPGDLRALETLYDRHASSMLALATRLLADRQEAEDLVHDVFVEAWKKADSFSAERGTVGAWLMVRVRSRAIDRLRRAKVARRFAEQEALPASELSASRPADAAEAVDRGRVNEALGDLGPDQRTIVELAYFGGLSCAEIAQRIDVPLGTVKSRLAAGLRELRRRFDSEGDGGGS